MGLEEPLARISGIFDLTDESRPIAVSHAVFSWVKSVAQAVIHYTKLLIASSGLAVPPAATLSTWV